MLIGNGDLRGCTNDSAASTSGSMWVITLEIGRSSVEQLSLYVSLLSVVMVCDVLVSVPTDRYLFLEFRMDVFCK